MTEIIFLSLISLLVLQENYITICSLHELLLRTIKHLVNIVDSKSAKVNVPPLTN